MPLYADLTIFSLLDASNRRDFTPILGTVDAAGAVTQATCSTDPAHPRPYLITKFGVTSPSTVNFLEGAARIGLQTLRIGDKRTVPSDQGTGWFTALLGDGNGAPAHLGLRALYREQERDGTWRVKMDGIISAERLMPSLTEYELALADVRERERGLSTFTYHETVSIIPRGPVSGYATTAAGGVIVPAAGWTRATLYPITNPVPAPPAGIAYRAFSLHRTLVPSPALPLGFPEPKYNPDGTVAWGHYPNLIIRWRLRDQPTTMREYRNLRNYGATSNLFQRSKYDEDAVVIPMPTGDIPAGNEVAVDIQVIYAGPPTEDFPLYVSGRLGGLPRRIADGEFAAPGAAGSRVRYNESALAAFEKGSPTTFFPITAPEKDARAWQEKHVYKPLGGVPALDVDGALAPFYYRLPDAAVPVVELGPDDVSDATWEVTMQDAITRVDFTYYRDYLPGPTAVEILFNRGNMVGPRGVTDLIERPITLSRRSVAGIDRLGERTLTYDAVTIRAVGAAGSGGPAQGDRETEAGAQVARQRQHDVLDRVGLGAVPISGVLRLARPEVRALQPGSWVVLTMPEFPSLSALRRGGSILAQIGEIQGIDPTRRRFRALAAGPSAQPVAVPVLATPRIDATTGRGMVDLTGMPATPTSAAVEVYAAVATARPADDSGDWLLLARIDPVEEGTAIVVPRTVSTPMTIPPGATVHFGARGVKAGTRRSGMVNAGSATAASTPALEQLAATVATDDRSVSAEWRANSIVAGVRLRWGVVAPGQAVAAGTYTSTLDVPVASSPAVLSVEGLLPGGFVAVSAEPWTVPPPFTTGAAGVTLAAEAYRPDADATGATPIIGTPVAYADRIEVPVTWDAVSEEVVVRTRTFPGAGAPAVTEANANLVEREGATPNGTPLYRQATERGTTVMVRVPTAGLVVGDGIGVVLIGFGPGRVRGVRRLVALAVEAAPAAVPAPGTPTATSATDTTVTNAVPVAGLTDTTHALRSERDGLTYGSDVVVTAAMITAGSAAMEHAGLPVGTASAWTYRTVLVSSGATSAATAAVTNTTTGGGSGTIGTPVLSVEAVFAAGADPSRYDFTTTPGTPTPTGTTYRFQQRGAGGVGAWATVAENSTGAFSVTPFTAGQWSVIALPPAGTTWVQSARSNILETTDNGVL